MCMCVCVSLPRRRLSRDSIALHFVVVSAACACIRIIFFLVSLVLFYLSPPLLLRCVALRVSCAAVTSPLGTCGSAAPAQCDAADDDDDVADLLACLRVCVCVCVNVACLLYVCVSMHVCWCVCCVHCLLFVVAVAVAAGVCCLLPLSLAHTCHAAVLLLPMLRRSAASLAVAVSTQFVRKKFSTACVGYGK